MLSKLSKGHKIGSSGAGAAIVCFFLPWILVSCNGQTIKSFSGWELAAGTTVNAGLGTRQIEGMPILFLVLLAGFGALAIAYFATQRGHLIQLDGFGSIGVGALPLLVLLGQLNSTQNDASQQGITVDYQYGLWGVIFGYLAVIVGGVINLRETSPTSTNSVAVLSSTDSIQSAPAPSTPIPIVQIGQINLDTETLKTAARNPLITAAGLSLIPLINISLGSFWGIVFTLTWIYAGLTYTRTALTTGASLQTLNLAIHGGILGGGAAIVYQIASRIVLSIQQRSSSFDFANLLAIILEASFIGALAAVAWRTYHSEKSN